MRVLSYIVLALLVSTTAHAQVFPDRYDKQIEAAWAEFHPNDDWHWWKAQLYQESLLNPDARSAAGALGIAQFMPATWEEITKAMRYGAVDRRMAEPSIRAGAFYMRRLVHIWRAKRPAEDRRKLAQASYNAGPGSIIRAQKVCEGGRRYEAIIWCLPRVTGKKNAHETTTYVERIRRWREAML